MIDRVGYPSYLRNKTRFETKYGKVKYSDIQRNVPYCVLCSK